MVEDPASGEDLRIPALDGFELAATLSRPPEDGSLPGAGRLVLVLPATAVYRGIYAKYARYLASQGFVVLTVDYRGTGDSLPGGLRGFEGRMRHWGERDIPGLIHWATEIFPDHRLLAVAHSVGGQILGLVETVDRLEAVWAVCAQWGTYRLWPWPRNWSNKLFAYVVGPGTTALFGYFPGRFLGMGDLPRSIGLDWMSWCGSRHYIIDDQGKPLRPHYHRLKARVRWNGFTDDPAFGPPRAVAAMPGLYPNGEHEVVITDPATIGDGPIGHFGFFRSRFQDSLWAESVEWLVGER